MPGMSYEAFEATLATATPPPGLSPALSALWYMARGDWNAAHELVQVEEGPDAAWVHAHLHRVEGDLSNAGYWYRRAGKPQSSEELDAERRSMTRALIGSTGRSQGD